ncbi:ABC transporter ATP-binding protein [Gloeobacter morelensis]|uniref:ATP-binding cassette domain-containing protein n=1 Tax=Gloeobacter morelensis MG652769 TaxID=2781736 RepID=A0ABY3PSV9_9CYAN|nr:ATP-binding cassette domain-containing protein [Gloeobacter morelensis]UFP96599.1 ATP-binding cassette domain-containing protein [Gloeobacter morelensis MG652769]
MEAAIRIEDLHKSYGSTKAVDGLSLTVAPGQIYGLLGPNGAGKTTTLRCLCTLERPDRGWLEVAGISVADDPRAVRQLLGYVAQEIALDKILTGRELLQLQADLYHLSRAAAREQIAQMLELLDLSERADERIKTYSGGLMKRLDLAAGLLHNPKVLVLDEPTVGLDIQSRLAVWNFLRELRRRGVTVLLTSHYLEEIDMLAARVAIIDRGRLIAEGTPEELKQRVGGERVTLRIREFSPAAEAREAAALLGALPFVKEVIINEAQGNALYLVVAAADPLSTVPTLREELTRSGLPLFGVALARPSLDDVFLAATGQTLQDADLAVGSRGKKKRK